MLKRLDSLLLIGIWMLNSSSLKERDCTLYYKLKDGIVGLRQTIAAAHESSMNELRAYYDE